MPKTLLPSHQSSYGLHCIGRCQTHTTVVSPIEKSNNVCMSMTGLQYSSFIRVFWVIALMLALAGCAGTRHHAGIGARAIVDGERRGDVVLTAMGLVDTRYRYGGGHPSLGFDCSGLVAYVFSTAAAQPLPHNSAAIADMSRPVSRRGLKAGDFVFFNTLNRPFSHMGIYIGDGQFVNAPSSGGRVRVDRLDNPYFAKRFESARTVFND
jgi:hypothetical protein